jgi:hypothetical protein
VEIRKYTPDVNEAALCVHRHAQPRFLGRVSGGSQGTVRDGFAAKKLGLAPDAADAGIKAVAEKMKATKQKNRAVFYYLLAEATDTLGKLN